jgi:hypothetical protein
LQEGEKVVVSNTFVKRWEMEPYLEMCADVTIVEAKGEYANIHGVPEEVVNRMRLGWEK